MSEPGSAAVPSSGKPARIPVVKVRDGKVSVNSKDMADFFRKPHSFVLEIIEAERKRKNRYEPGAFVDVVPQEGGDQQEPSVEITRITPFLVVIHNLKSKTALVKEYITAFSMAGRPQKKEQPSGSPPVSGQNTGRGKAQIETVTSETEPAPDLQQEEETPTSGADFEPLNLLVKLKEQAASGAPSGPLEETLPWATIRQMPELFQPRGILERHVSELVSALKMNERLDPVTVIQVGSETILIEGHHRMLAYQRAKIREGIPVVYFTGNIEEAVLEAGRANSKSKLPMMNIDRQNYAWRLVLMGGFSKSQITLAAGISNGQTAIMRRVLKKLGLEAFGHKMWWQAQRAAQSDESFQWNPEEAEERKEALARNYAERLSAQFFDKLQNNIEVAAMALAYHFGGKLGDLHRELGGHIEGGYGEVEEDGF